jgi:hypothetical protein
MGKAEQNATYFLSRIFNYNIKLFNNYQTIG